MWFVQLVSSFSANQLLLDIDHRTHSLQRRTIPRPRDSVEVVRVPRTFAGK